MAYIFLMIAFIGVIIGMFKAAKKKRILSREIVLTVFLGIICLAILICVIICCF